ncbi:MAG TPA: uracil-DNA glycosylase family protein [Paraburkholderia sp.]|jgi:DNA polymerase
MPLDEIALEELGLAPRWVRKGVQGVVAEHAVRGDEVTASVPARTVQTEPTHAQAARPVVTPLPAETRVGQAEAARSEQVERVAQPESPLARPASLSSDEPPPLTEDDFGWFDSVAAPAAPHDTAPSRASGAARSEVATLDWDSLAERVASCTQCRLCEKRTNTVFGVGDREADWMLIGEAPGENEDRLGEPFVGQAGKLLDNMLHALSLARGENVYIANVIKCRPPGNRNPEPDEVARCEPYLQRQVALVKPKIIVALGRFAAQSLLKTDGSIASLRGRVHEYEGVPVIVTYHPAYLLRSLHDKAKAWADLCLARDTWGASGDER